jgi:Putative prokaryotic signal transducing protein
VSELVQLTVVPNQAEAELIRNQLELEGIESMRRPTNFGAGTMDGFSGGQQEILVNADDLERARELLSGD